MAVATTTAALIAGGIAAAGTTGTAVAQSRAANKATDAQRQANDEALRLEREAQAKEEAEAAKALEDRKERWYRWFQEHGDAGIQRYGMPDFFDPFPGAVVQRGGGGQPPTPVPGPIPTPAPTAPQGLGALGGRPPSAPTGLPLMDSQQGESGGLIPRPTQPPQGTLGQLGGWNDWDRYLGGAN